VSGARGNESSAASAIIVSALLAFNLAVVGPQTLHAGNVDEYSVSFWSVLGYLAAGAGVLSLALSALLLLIPRQIRGRAVVFVFSVAALAWLQGNWLLGDYGLLDGDALDFEANSEARLRDAAVWIAGIAGAQIVYRFLRRHVTAVAGVFLALQAMSLPLAAMTTNSERSDPRASLPVVADAEIFEFSSQANIILLILDTFTSDTFVQFADQEPEHFDRAYAGFVAYTDTVGAFPSTQYALPVMLGAPPYDNRIPVDDYMSASLQRDGINRRLLERGYAVDWVSAWPLFCRQGTYSTCYAIPRPYVPPGEYRRRMAAELFDISLFRHAPHDVKKLAYAGGDWLVQAALWKEEGPPVFVSSAVDFFTDFNAAVRIGRQQPTFKILHAAGGHGPFVFDADCAAVESRPYNRANYEALVRCGLNQTEALLQRLRELGVYDGATIIVAGDHGASFGARASASHGLDANRLARARPLLAVKWPGAKGGLKRSPAPASIQDIAPTIAAAAGLDAAFPGRDLAELDSASERQRSYGIYVLRKGTPGGHLHRVERYKVAAGSERPAAWQFDEAVASPAVDLTTGFIDAGAPEGADHLAYLGWGEPVKEVGGASFVPALGPVATVVADLPPGEPVELRARLRARQWSLPQVIAVEVDGVRIGSWRIEELGFGEHAIAVPAAFVGEGATAISFRPRNFERPGARGRTSGFDLDWIRFQPSDSR
jgi:hypothetical protein